MDYFERNLKIINQRFSTISRWLKHLNPMLDASGADFFTECARDGNKISGVYTEQRRVCFHSTYRPAEEAKRFVEQYELADARQVVSMFGLGAGYFVTEIMKKLKQGDSLLIFEPSSAYFVFCIKEFDWSDILSDGRVFLVCDGINTADFASFLYEHVHWSNVSCQTMVVHPQYEGLYPVKHAFFHTIWKDNNTQVISNRNTEVYFGKLKTENLLKNLPFLREAGSVSQIKDVLWNLYRQDELSAVIVSAGPSLDKNIEELQRAKGHCLLLAVDAALNPLLNRGIVPDFAVSIDAEKDVSCYTNPIAHTIPLLCEAQATHGIIRQIGAPIFLFNSSPFLTKAYEKAGSSIPMMSVGGSVATGAFALCEYFGIRRIVLVGQDLAFLGEVSHAGGRTQKIIAEETGITYTEGIDGTPIKTRYDWEMYRRWFEQEIQTGTGKFSVTDATEGGARIHGAELLRLNEAIDRYCISDFDCTRLLASIPSIWNTKESAERKQFFKRAAEECTELEADSKTVVTQCEQVLSQFNNDRKYERRKIWLEINAMNEKASKYSVFSLVDDCIKEVTVSRLQMSGKHQSDDNLRERLFFENVRDVHQAILQELPMIATKLLEAEERF